MDETTSFLEHPLDQNLYEPKKFAPEPKEPLRILISEAGGKIAYNLIYQICNGSVFGQDQEIILHLQNSKGVLHHKTIALELLECGFPCFKDVTLSSNPAVAFKDVNVVIIIAAFEEISGWAASGTVIHQVVKSIYLVKYVEEYASKDCKIIFTGPGTKALTLLLSVLPKFFFKIPPENISCVTCLDTFISKAVLGQKLRITTDRLKNIIIWSNTYPDVSNATVRMYPSDDMGLWEMKDIPVIDAVQDDEWLYKTFGLSIYKRIMNPDLLNYGKAIAMATAHHMKVLFTGSRNFDEIHSMGVLTPSTEPYGVPMCYGFSYPVVTENGKWKILQDVKVGVPTQINMMNTCSKTIEWNIKNRLIKALHSMMDNELSQKQTPRLLLNHDSGEILNIKKWDAKYFVTPNPAESVEKPQKHEGRTSRKSIVWDDAIFPIQKLKNTQKSFIRFSVDSLKSSKKNSVFSKKDSKEISKIHV